MLQFPYAFLEKYIPQIDAVRFEIPYETTDGKVQRQIEALEQELKELVACVLSEERASNRLPLYIHALTFLDMLYRFFWVEGKEEPGRRHKMQRLQAVMDYTEKNYSHTIHIKDVSNVVALQPQYFCRFFKEAAGVTYLEYLNMVRLTHIYEDIIHTDDPIYEIRNRHGFTNYKLFRKLFFDKFQSTPMELRKTKKQQREQDD